MALAVPSDPRAELQARLAALDDPELGQRVARELAPVLESAEVDSERDRGPGAARLRLTAAGSGRLVARRLPAGSWVVYQPDPGRRWLTIDRAGQVMEALEWRPDGSLGQARVRLADGGWLEVRPRAATHLVLGEADAIIARSPSHAGSLSEPEATHLTVAGALDWAAIDHLPPLDRPGALPPGGGSALFTLIAGLLTDQSRPVVRYRGPYPTRALFDRLLIAFRPRAAGGGGGGGAETGDLEAARDIFTADAEAMAFAGRTTEPPVDFEPAPPERMLLAEGTLAHLRDGVQEVIDGGRVYAASDLLATLWPGRCGLLVAGLAFLGEPLEEHLVLDPEGDLVARIDDRITGADEGESDGDGMLEAPFDDRWRRSLAALLVAESARLLAHPLLELVLATPIAWGATDGRWVEARAGGWVVNGALPARFRARHALVPATEREPLAARFIAEVARALGDPLRRTAQERVEAAIRGTPPEGGALNLPSIGGADAAPHLGTEGLTEELVLLARHLAAGHAP